MQDESFELQALPVSVICTASDAAGLDRIINALERGGYGNEIVNVLHGEEGLRIVDADGEYSGPFGQLMRSFQKFTTGVDERTLNAMQETLEHGGYIITVTTDGSEEERDAIHALMRQAGGRHIFYNGSTMIELLSGW
jgi:hypothetical protein